MINKNKKNDMKKRLNFVLSKKYLATPNKISANSDSTSIKINIPQLY